MTTKNNLIQEIANHLMDAAPVTTPALAYGAAIAVMSTVIGRSYCVRFPMGGLSPEDEALLTQHGGIEDKYIQVNQSVVLVGESGVGKQNTLSAVETLLNKVNSDYLIVYGFADKEALWRSAQDKIPLVIENDLEHKNYAGQLSKAFKKGDGYESILLSLQTQKDGIVDRPFSNKQPGSHAHILPSALTVLAETRSEYFERETLAIDNASNPFYSGFLFVMADDEIVKSYRGIWRDLGGVPQASGDLIEKLRSICDSRLTDKPSLVDISDEAERFFLGFTALALTFLSDEPDFVEPLLNQTLNVAALMAIGKDPQCPKIEMRDIVNGIRIALVSAEWARYGLGSNELSRLSEWILDEGGLGEN